jgi:hypothetical protein
MSVLTYVRKLLSPEFLEETTCPQSESEINALGYILKHKNVNVLGQNVPMIQLVRGIFVQLFKKSVDVAICRFEARDLLHFKVLIFWIPLL